MVNVGQLTVLRTLSSEKFKALTMILIKCNLAILHIYICEKFNRSQKW